MKKRLTLLFIGLASFSFAQESITYQKPSAEILQLAEYDRPPSVSMDSKKEWMVLSYRPTYKTLEDLSQEEMKLAGLRVNPITNISSTAVYQYNLKIKRIKDATETQVKGLPQQAKITNLSFSPDRKTLAFTNTLPKVWNCGSSISQQLRLKN
ncbi:hypothetical protein [Sphingobacterium spiritivorum]|uniref:hypothetical protein n=1 Tax=Sphingobacterium spiritivorum TaxID=258 RepID=UPI003DA3BC31